MGGEIPGGKGKTVADRVQERMRNSGAPAADTAIACRDGVCAPGWGCIVLALTRLIEIKDPYTHAHQRRVTDLAFAIAARMGLGNGQTQGLLTAAAIHDLGKVAIPSGILHKPGKLTATEFTLIKSHPEIGFEVLKNINFAWPVAEIVLQHHERLDGSGYPQGLRGGDILLEARILAVADVVEAMASHRPYRPAHGIDRALQEIAQNAGTLYDPAVVDACLQLFREGAFHFAD